MKKKSGRKMRGGRRKMRGGNSESTYTTTEVISIVLLMIALVLGLMFYFRKTHKGIWLLNEKTTNLLEYYENIPEVECSDKKTIV